MESSFSKGKDQMSTQHVLFLEPRGVCNSYSSDWIKVKLPKKAFIMCLEIYLI